MTQTRTSSGRRRSSSAGNSHRVPTLAWVALPALAVVGGLAFASVRDSATADRPDDKAFLVALDGQSSFDPYNLTRVAAQSPEIVGGGNGSGEGVSAGLVGPLGGSGFFSPPGGFRSPRPRSPFVPPPTGGGGPFG